MQVHNYEYQTAPLGCAVSVRGSRGGIARLGEITEGRCCDKQHHAADWPKYLVFSVETRQDSCLRLELQCSRMTREVTL